MFPGHFVKEIKKPFEGIEMKARDKNEVSTCPAVISIHSVNIARTGISIKVVPKKRKKVEYTVSAKGLSGKTNFVPEYNIIHRLSTKFKGLLSHHSIAGSCYCFYFTSK